MSEIESTEQLRGAQLVRSIIPPLGLPSFDSGRYILDMRINQTWPEHSFGEYEIPFTDNAENVARALGRAAHTIAWLEFFAKPEITFKHSDLAVQNGAHYHREYYPEFPFETVTGRRFSVGENHYAVDYNESEGITLKTHSEILQAGALEPYMEEWLARILSEKNWFHPSPHSLQPFATWLRKSRPDNDFYPGYFI